MKSSTCFCRFVSAIETPWHYCGRTKRENQAKSVIIYLTTIEGCGILHLEAAYELDRRCQTVRHTGSLQRFSGVDALARWRRVRPLQQQARIEVCEAGQHPPTPKRENRTDGNEACSGPHPLHLP